MDTITSALLEMRDKLKGFLAGRLDQSALIEWAQRHPMSLRGQDEAHVGNRRQGELLDTAFSAVLVMHPDEPEEYRTQRGELEQIVRVLDGEEPYEGEIIRLDTDKKGG